MDLLEFIELTNDVKKLDDLKKFFLAFLAPFGLESFALADLSPQSLPELNQSLTMLNGYDPEWIDHYIQQDYILDDPLYLKAHQALGAYSWTEALRENSGKRSQRIMNEAEDFGYLNGVGIPYRGPNGSFYLIGISASERDIRDGKASLGLLFSAGQQFMMTFLEEFGPVKKQNLPLLTVREQEILCWAAIGKTRSEIADSLALSFSTVKRHIEHIFVKLGVQNLPSAVALGLRTGIISP